MRTDPMIETMCQVYWDDMEEGQEIPLLTKGPITTRTIMQWGAAVGDYYEIHYDDRFAREVAHLPGVIVHGTYKFALLGQLLSDWHGPAGWVRRLGCSYRGMDVPGDVMTARGRIKGKLEQEGEHLVEVEVWTQNPRGERTTVGEALVLLPKREGAPPG